jgi:integrase
VLEAELPWLDDIESAKTPKRLPVVLTEQEVRAILSRVEGSTGLMLRLIYGSGVRIMECLRLRVKDIEFVANCLFATGRARRTASRCCRSRSCRPFRTILDV